MTASTLPPMPPFGLVIGPTRMPSYIEEHPGTVYMLKTEYNELRSWAEACRAERDALEQSLLEMREKYHDLLYQVADKYAGESRHQTAKRIIQAHQNAQHGPAPSIGLPDSSNSTQGDNNER